MAAEDTVGRGTKKRLYSKILFRKNLNRQYGKE